MKGELASDSGVAQLAGQFADMGGISVVGTPKRIVLAGHPGFELVGMGSAQQMDQTFVQRAKYYFVLHERGLVMLGGSVVVTKASEASLEPLFETYSPHFLRVANSLTFPIFN